VSRQTVSGWSNYHWPRQVGLPQRREGRTVPPPVLEWVEALV
jgi:hypothetical protein